MKEYTCTKANKDKFAIFHTIYTDSNTFLRFCWNERVNIIKSNDNGYFISLEDKLIGGFSLSDNNLSNPFMIPPFDNRLLIWKFILDYSLKECCKNHIHLNAISQADMELLTKHFSVNINTVQRIMLRPTEQSEAILDSKFYFSEVSDRDIPNIVQTIFEAHSLGYTSKFKTPVKTEIENAINYRFDAFSKTKTLYFSSMVRSIDNNDIVGVCIAGIYPDSPNNFSTIHQVSVLPEYRRKGIAEAMISRTINTAQNISPVITLGVMVGNPAEQLYNKLGFSSGPSYYNLTYTVQ